MATDPIGGTGSASGNQTRSADDALRGLDMSEFLNLMIAELQNQDPLNPMENAEILSQISQIREIGATSQLSDTLSAVLAGQNISSASALIGKKIEGVTDDGKKVNGVVDKVSIAGGVPRLHIGTTNIALKNVAEIVPST